MSETRNSYLEVSSFLLSVKLVALDFHLLLLSLAGRQTRQRKVWLKESDQEKTEPVC